MAQGWSTLKAKKDFQRLYRHGQRIGGRYVVMYYRAGETKAGFRLRAGIVCGRRVGKAVVRNHIRRIIKEIIRRQIAQLHCPAEMVLVARPESGGVDFWALEKELKEMWQRAGLIS